MPKITVAKTAGFCFGVDRAIKIIEDLLDNNKKVCTLGPIIHNQQVVDSLADRGVRIIGSVSAANPDETVVIRSHGVSPDVYKELDDNNINYVDATCPFVSKAHKIVEDNSTEANTVLIAGDENHPEVKAIRGYAKGKSFVFKDDLMLEDIIKSGSFDDKEPQIILTQTTFNENLWKKCDKIAKKLCTNPKIFDTICKATHLRQEEAITLAKNVDCMIVIGGRHSSNTNKLYELCSQYTLCYHIETADELQNYDFRGVVSVGITAGASTPAYLIEEVQNTMTDILTEKEDNFNFEEAIEKSFRKLYTGNRVKGVVTSVNNNEAIVDIGVKQTGYIPRSELTDDTSLAPTDVVKPGDEVELIVIKVNDQEGVVTLSKKKVDAMVGFEKLVEAKENGTILDGVVTNVVKGGILVLVNSIKVFVPASLASDSRVENLETLLKKEVKLIIIDINEQRGRAVGSIRAVLRDEKKAQREEFWANVKVGDTFKGEVKSLTNYGAFVNLGPVEGMVHITELSWNRIKHPSQVVSVGDILEVYIKDIEEKEGKKRISLGFKKAEDNPWTKLKEMYNEGDVVTGKVASITPFGAFVTILDGIDGLVHISQISYSRVNNVADVLTVGQEVEAKLLSVDYDNQKVSLSIKALLTPPEPNSGLETVEEAEAPAETIDEVIEEVVEAPVEDVAEETVETPTEEAVNEATTDEATE